MNQKNSRRSIGALMNEMSYVVSNITYSCFIGAVGLSTNMDSRENFLEMKTPAAWYRNKNQRYGCQFQVRSWIDPTMKKTGNPLGCDPVSNLP